MDDFLNGDICEFNNDASASSFGWNFQANAGIFLFLKYLPKARDIKIESKLQDIEITLVDSTKVFAQAKSAQDYTIIKNSKDKFKDAIISLSRNPYKDNQLLYISNIPNMFKVGSNISNNSIISYNDCLDAVKNEIDSCFASIVTSISKKICTTEDSKQKEKLNKAKNDILAFHKENLYISTIDPYCGAETNRYRIIEDTILSFLTDTIKLTRDDAITLKSKLLTYWQLKFQHNSTVKDNTELKKITKEDFSWPILAYLVDGNFPDIEDCLTFTVDSSVKQDVSRIINDPSIFYHERYEFTNEVLQQYLQFKKTLANNSTKNPERDFIEKNYKNFVYEFNTLVDKEDTDYDDLVEYITKAFLYRILTNYRNVQKICKNIGVKV